MRMLRIQRKQKTKAEKIYSLSTIHAYNYHYYGSLPLFLLRP